MSRTLRLLNSLERRLFAQVRREARSPAFGPLSKFRGGRNYLDTNVSSSWDFNPKSLENAYTGGQNAESIRSKIKCFSPNFYGKHRKVCLFSAF